MGCWLIQHGSDSSIGTLKIHWTGGKMVSSSINWPFVFKLVSTSGFFFSINLCLFYIVTSCESNSLLVKEQFDLLLQVMFPALFVFVDSFQKALARFLDADSFRLTLKLFLDVESLLSSLASFPYLDSFQLALECFPDVDSFLSTLLGFRDADSFWTVLAYFAFSISHICPQSIIKKNP